MELGSGAQYAEAPIDAGLSLVSFQFQGLDLPAERFLVRETLPEAAAGDNTELDLRHIQPTAMLGRVVKLQTPRYAPRLLRRKSLVQRRLAVGIEIVQHQADHRDIGVGLVYQPAHLMGDVLGGAPLGHFHVPPPGQGFAEQEQVAGALPPLLVVLPPRIPGLGRQWFSDVGQQLGGGLVETDHRALGVVGFGVQVQDVLHVSHEVGAHLGNAPLFPLPRFKGVFSDAAAPSRGTGTPPSGPPRPTRPASGTGGLGLDP